MLYFRCTIDQRGGQDASESHKPGEEDMHFAKTESKSSPRVRSSRKQNRKTHFNAARYMSPGRWYCGLRPSMGFPRDHRSTIRKTKGKSCDV